MAKPMERKTKKKPGKAPPKRRGKALSSENGGGRNSAKRGPRLPSALRKELDRLNPVPAGSGDEVGDVSARGDVYEYDEAVAEEESKKNRRFDSVDNLEYELPDDFEVGFCGPLSSPCICLLSSIYYVYGDAKIGLL